MGPTVPFYTSPAGRELASQSALHSPGLARRGESTSNEQSSVDTCAKASTPQPARRDPLLCLLCAADFRSR